MKLNLWIRLGLVSAGLLLGACSAKYAADSGQGSSSSTAAAPSLGRVTMSVANAANQVIFTDLLPASLQLTAGQTYTVNLAVTNPVPGATYRLQTTQTNVPSGSVQSLPLQIGANTLTLPPGSQGDYAWTLKAVLPSGITSTKNYIAAVQCSTPVLGTSSLIPSALSVTSSGNNLYTFNAAGVVPSTGGPYQCAFDVTGTGIQSTSFLDCATPVNAYVNLVGVRNIGVIVKDQCFSTASASSSLNLASTAIAMPGNTFIQGVITGATGSVAGDPRVDGVSYLATNVPGHVIVRPSYRNGAFTIASSQNYGTASSAPFGVSIVISGLTDTLNYSTGTGTIDASGAQVSKVIFTTDQAGDQRPPISISSQACTLTNQHATATPITGSPCATGTTGDRNGFTIEVWGHYTCPALTASGASAKFEGDFDGVMQRVNSCVGGGSTSSGGTQPIAL